MRSEFSYRLQINERARRIAARTVAVGSLTGVVINGFRVVGQIKDRSDSPEGKYIFEVQNVQDKVSRARRVLVDRPWERNEIGVSQAVFGINEAQKILSDRRMDDLHIFTQLPPGMLSAGPCEPKQIVSQLRLSTKALDFVETDAVREIVRDGRDNAASGTGFWNAADKLEVLNQSASVCVARAEQLPLYKAMTDKLGATSALEGLFILTGIAASLLSYKVRNKK